MPRPFAPSSHSRKFSPRLVNKAKDLKLNSSASKQTPPRKLRHEDSQIQFEAIASSSPVQLETRNLTEHQKEVAERQRLDAGTMFQDIKRDSHHERLSSPMIIDSDLAVASSDSEELQSSQPSTPVIGPTHDAHDDDVPSSPITASVSRRQHRSSSSNPKSPREPDIPSSPPSPVGELRASLQSARAEEMEVAETNITDSLPEYEVVVEIEVPSTKDAPTQPPSSAYETAVTENSAPKQAGLVKAGTREDEGSSDDHPSSQLHAELMASQSSPTSQSFLSVEREEIKISRPDFTDAREDQSTVSMITGLTTADDLFPEGIPETVLTDSYNALAYAAERSVSQNTQESLSSQIGESQMLKRKRGRPTRNSLLNVQTPGCSTQFSGPSQDGLATPTKSISSVEGVASENSLLDMGSNVTSSTASEQACRSSSRVRKPTSKLVDYQATKPQGSPACGSVTHSPEAKSDTQESEPGSKRQKSHDGSTVSLIPDAVSTDDVVIPQAETEAVASKSPIEGRAVLTPKSIMARLRSLSSGDATSGLPSETSTVTCRWLQEERREGRSATLDHWTCLEHTQEGFVLHNCIAWYFRLLLAMIAIKYQSKDVDVSPLSIAVIVVLCTTSSYKWGTVADGDPTIAASFLLCLGEHSNRTNLS